MFRLRKVTIIRLYIKNVKGGLHSCSLKFCNYTYSSIYQQIGLKFEEEPSEMLRLEHGSVRCWNLDTSGNRSDTPGKFWNVVLEKDGEDQLDRSCEKWRSVT